MSKNTQGASVATTNATTSAREERAIYEVMVPQVKIGRVIAYRSARVSLTQQQAELLNSVQAGTVQFIGI